MLARIKQVLGKSRGAAVPLPASPRWGEEPDSRPRRGFRGGQNIRANAASTALGRPSARLWSPLSRARERGRGEGQSAHPNAITPLGAHVFCPPLNPAGGGGSMLRTAVTSAIHAAPPYPDGMTRGCSWEGCALPHPPAGGGMGKPGFPIPLREGLALPGAGGWTTRAVQSPRGTPGPPAGGGMGQPGSPMSH